MFEAAFIELLLVKTSECRRQTTKRPDQLELRSNDRNDETKSDLSGEFEPILGFALRITERIPGAEKIRVQVVAAICRKSKVADLVCGVEGTTLRDAI